MMARTLITCAAAAALGLLASHGWQQGPVGLQATVPDPLADTDDDLLPDMVEWAVVTNGLRPDTDYDGVPDFLEVVQNSMPRRVSTPPPHDHEMRVVLASTLDANGARQTWLHILFRVMGPISAMTSFRIWVQVAPLPGIQIPLESLTAGHVTVRQREVPQEGLWAILSAPLVPEDLLRLVLPCTVVAEARIGERSIRSGTQVFGIGQTAATLVPFESGIAIQTLSREAAVSGGGSNKICVIRLERVGSTVAGTIYRARDAACDDCNDLECGIGCPESVGWIFVIPGGIETITGG
jgi:hypothetical protein